MDVPGNRGLFFVRLAKRLAKVWFDQRAIF
jgi:hypothetical protein